MDEREIELRFKLIGLIEEEREKRIDKIKKEGIKWTPCNLNDNLFGLFAIPKFPLKNHFDDKGKINEFYNEELIKPFSIHKPRRLFNRFYFNLNNGEGALNFYYDGSMSLIISLNYFIDDFQGYECINPLYIYSFIYRFLCIVGKYYSLFKYYGFFDIHFDLRGIRGKYLLCREYNFSAELINLPSKGTAVEEIDPYIKTCDIRELEIKKTAIAQEMILPLFYSYNIDKPVEIWDENGFPRVNFDEEFWIKQFGC